MPDDPTKEIVAEEDFESTLQDLIDSAIENEVSVVGHWVFEGEPFDLEMEIVPVRKDRPAIPGDEAKVEDS